MFLFLKGGGRSGVGVGGHNFEALHQQWMEKVAGAVCSVYGKDW